MIFSSKLKVGQSHSNQSSDNQKINEDKNDDVVYAVELVIPDTRKYVVKLNKEHLCTVPVGWWNLSWALCGVARILKLDFPIFPTVLPKTNKGNATNIHKTTISKIVPKGRAAVTL